MNYLLDTHVFLWYIKGDRKLNKKYKKIIEDYKNNVYISIISIWESIIKAKLGKLNIPEPIFNYLDDKRKLHKIDIINFENRDLSNLEQLPDVHKDPFDRLLICQSISNELIFITDDEYILKYPVKTIDSK